MTQAQQGYEDLVSRASDVLAAHGFRRRGKSLWRHDGASTAIIQFQRSQDSGRDWIVFTVNIGLAYHALPRIVDWDPDGGRLPKTYDCHIEERIGYVLPDRSPADYWWLIDGDTDVEELERAFTSYLDGPVIEFVNSLSSLSGLRRHWLRKADRGAIHDRELVWLKVLDPSVDTDALAAKPERAARRVRQQVVGPVDFSQLPPLLIETRKPPQD